MSVPKNSKAYHFHDEWEIEYFFFMVKDKCCCLTCNASVSLSKKSNPEGHYNAFHSNKCDAYFPPESEIRKLKLKQLKLKPVVQKLKAKPMLQPKNVTLPSFKVRNLIVKKCSLFIEGKFVNECFLETAGNLFERFKSKKEIIATIQDLQLSRNTIVQRIERMCGNITEQLLKDFFQLWGFLASTD
jgi:hypothetical protein